MADTSHDIVLVLMCYDLTQAQIYVAVDDLAEQRDSGTVHRRLPRLELTGDLLDVSTASPDYRRLSTVLSDTLDVEVRYTRYWSRSVLIGITDGRQRLPWSWSTTYRYLTDVSPVLDRHDRPIFDAVYRDIGRWSKIEPIAFYFLPAAGFTIPQVATLFEHLQLNVVDPSNLRKRMTSNRLISERGRGPFTLSEEALAYAETHGFTYPFQFRSQQRGTLTSHTPTNFKALTQRMRARADAQWAQGEEVAERVVLLSGSGALAWPDAPSWRDFKRVLVAEFENDTDVHPLVFNTLGLSHINWQRLAEDARVSTNELAIALGDSRLRDEVQQCFVNHFSEHVGAAGPVPSLTYELIAHLVSHGAIDHVVDFDFGAGLSDSMLCELGESGVQRVTGAGMPVDGLSGQVPIHYQLHGSVLARDTMRFSAPRLPRDSEDVFEVIFPRGVKTTILSLGYSWGDQGVIQWLKTHEDRLSDIFVVRSRDEVPAALAAANMTTAVRIISTDALVEHAVPGLAVDQFVWALAEELESSFRDDYAAFPSIARHVILAYLFGRPFWTVDQDQGRSVEYRNAHSVESRLFIELLFHIAKLKGLFRVNTLADDYRIRRQINATQPADVSSLLGRVELKQSMMHPAIATIGLDPPLDESRDEAAGVERLVGILRRASDLIAMEARPGLRMTEAELKRSRVDQPAFDGATNSVQRTPTPDESFLRQMLGRMWSASQLEVHRGKDAVAHLTFAEPQQIVSFGQFVHAARDLLNQPWDYVFVLCNSGDLIHALASSETSTGQSFTIGSSNTPEYGALSAELAPPHHFAAIPWWSHNKLVLLTVKDNAFVGGLFARRANRASAIHPVYVSEAADAARLFRVFAGYLGRAREQGAGDLAAFSSGLETCSTQLLEHYREDPTTQNVIIEGLSVAGFSDVPA